VVERGGTRGTLPRKSAQDGGVKKELGAQQCGITHGGKSRPAGEEDRPMRKAGKMGINNGKKKREGFQEVFPPKLSWKNAEEKTKKGGVAPILGVAQLLLKRTKGRSQNWGGS